MFFCCQSFLEGGRVRLGLWKGNLLFLGGGLYIIVRFFFVGYMLGTFVTSAARFVGFSRDFVDNIFVVGWLVGLIPYSLSLSFYLSLSLSLHILI